MSSSNKALIKAVLEILNCNQKELAATLNVSPTQITKWKQGEHMSDEMKSQIKSLCNMSDIDPELLAIIGHEDNYKNWYDFICKLATFAYENGETGYACSFLQLDEPEMLVANVLTNLKKIGFDVPEALPEALVISVADPDFDLEEENEGHPLYAVIYKVFEALNDLSGFFDAYVSPIVFEDENNEDMMDLGYETEYQLIDLAFVKSIDGKNKEHSEAFLDFRFETNNALKANLKEIKLFAMKNNLPLGAELINLLSKSHNESGVEAEQESLGFNDSRLHPDIYMHELLQGNRVINQVLPKICEKLGITEFDFKDLTQNL